MVQSAVAHKVHSVKSVSWTTEAPARKFRIEEICPYKSEHPFWKKEGGAVIDQDIHTHVITVRGGEWRLTIYNDSTSDVSIEMWLAFMFDGADYQALEGTVDEAWHPNMSGHRFHEACKLSRWRKSIILKPQSTRKFIFKIGCYTIKVAEWFTRKKGWPFLYTAFNAGDPAKSVSLKFTLTYQLTFTEGEDSRYAMSRDEMNKFVRSIAMLREQLGINIAGPADTTMDESARPTV